MENDSSSKSRLSCLNTVHFYKEFVLKEKLGGEKH